MNPSAPNVVKSSYSVRHVSRALVDSLPDLEKLFAERYIGEGRWIIDNPQEGRP